ncbi:MAG: protein-disulfide reductase DsbD family protein [Tepidisphaeraceae bacterium]
MKPWAILLPVALLSSVAFAEQRHVKVEAVADRTAVKPGDTFTVALNFTIDPGWHIYWANPGETGTPPKAKWKLPAGVKIGDAPVPVPHRMDGAVTAFGYQKAATLLYTVTVPAEAKSTVELKANVSWVVCSDETCVSERQTVAL